MSTRTIVLTLTEEERGIIGTLLENARFMADDVRMGTIPGSEREQQALIYQLKIETIQAKYRESLNGSPVSI